jgi:hypothetical protein
MAYAALDVVGTFFASIPQLVLAVLVFFLFYQFSGGGYSVAG